MAMPCEGSLPQFDFKRLSQITVTMESPHMDTPDSFSTLQRRGTNSDFEKRHCMYAAAKCGDEARIHRLLGEGVDINGRDGLLRTPLHAAAWQQHNNVVRLLCEKGANPNCQDKWGQTPLIWTARDGHTDTVRLLIELGANPNLADSNGRTALHYAAQFGHTETALALIGLGGDPLQKDDAIHTASHVAKLYGKKDCYQMLKKIESERSPVSQF